MGRSKWKGPFLNFTKLEENRKVEKKNMAVNRNSEIVPSFIGLTYNVYNGKSFFEVNVSENMVGHKFGEFSFTRAKFFYKKKKLKK